MKDTRDFFGSYYNTAAYKASEVVLNRDVSSKLRNIRSFYKQPHSIQNDLMKKSLLRTLQRANKSVPYYKDLFSRHKVSISKIEKDISYFQDIPILTKQEIFNNFEKLISDDHRNKELITRRTNGSTGKSLPVLYSKEDLDWTAATNLFTYKFSNRQLNQKECHLEVSLASNSPIRKRCTDFLKNKVLNRDTLSLRTFAPEEMNRLLTEIQSGQYKVIQSYPSIMYKLATHLCKESNISHPRFDYFISTGESVSNSQIEIISKAFGCKVLNRYGLAEFGAVAHSMGDSNHLSFFPHIVYPELVSPLSTIQKEKQLILTSLRRDAMPLIRYNTGDLCLQSEDQRDFNNQVKIKNLVGRSHEVVKLNNKVLPTYFFQEIILQDSRINDFNLIASNENEVKSIEISTFDSARSRDEIRNKLKKLFNNIDIQFNDKIGNLRMNSTKKSYLRYEIKR